MNINHFKRRLGKGEVVSIQVYRLEDAINIEDILLEYGYNWNSNGKYVERVYREGLLLDVNFKSNKVISFSSELNDMIHSIENTLVITPHNRDKIIYLFVEPKPTYKPKQIIRTI